MRKSYNKKTIYFICILALLVLIAAVIILFSKKDAGKLKKNVVCSFYPVYIMTENLLKNTDVSVTNMTVTLTGCIHDYQITTADMKSLENADVLIVNGGGMESFTDNVRANYADLQIIEASSVIDTENPHFWMSVDSEFDAIDYVAGNLKKIFPEYSDQIAKNTDAYADRLQIVYERKLEIADKIGNSSEDICVICFNEAFEVFADSLSLYTIAVFSTDADEVPSAGEIRDAIENAKMHEKTIIMVEEENIQSAEKIVSETGAMVVLLNALTGGDGDMDSYINGMNENFKKIAEVLE